VWGLLFPEGGARTGVSTLMSMPTGKGAPRRVSSLGYYEDGS